MNKWQKLGILQCGVALFSRIDKIADLLCRILSLLQGSFAKETYHLIDPTNQNHSIETLHSIKDTPSPLSKEYDTLY